MFLPRTQSLPPGLVGYVEVEVEVSGGDVVGVVAEAVRGEEEDAVGSMDMLLALPCRGVPVTLLVTRGLTSQGPRVLRRLLLLLLLLLRL
jgi:hypothetical protein